QCEQHRSDKHAWYRRHEEPLPVAWVFVMIAVQRIGQFPYPWPVADPVKNIAMRNVFEKRPAKYGPGKKQQDNRDRVRKIVVTVPEHVPDQREVHSPND